MESFSCLKVQFESPRGGAEMMQSGGSRVQFLSVDGDETLHFHTMNHHKSLYSLGCICFWSRKATNCDLIQIEFVHTRHKIGSDLCREYVNSGREKSTTPHSLVHFGSYSRGREAEIGLAAI